MEGPRTPAILVVDSIEVFRIGLTTVLRDEFRGLTVGEAATRSAAIDHLKKRYWNLLIADAQLVDQELLAVIRDSQKGSPMALLSIGTDKMIQRAVRASRFIAASYIPRNVKRGELAKIVKTLVTGKSHSAATLLRMTAEAAAPHAKLSSQERMVMLSLARGERLVNIANASGLDARTISTYKHRIFNKLGFGSSADLVRYVMRHKLD